MTQFKRVSRSEVNWSRFLFHYTRASIGPWPGQSYEDYLVDLLEDAPHARHTALDTLARILCEQRIRASARLLKGGEPAVSLTSIAPLELTRLRRWNNALARWTVEPFGVGIDRSILRQRGAKPAVYGPQTLYETLNERDRFRYQKHQAPGCLWKHEREWRLPQDLSLDAVPFTQRLVFVPTEANARRLAERVWEEWTLIVLEE